MPDFLPELPDAIIPQDDPHATIFTFLQRQNNLPALRPERPALLVSSTSWTADEDFSLLIRALDIYQAALSSGRQGNDQQGARKLPKLLVIITGKGALRKAFEKTVAERERTSWTDVTVRCTFVSARDYPVLLGCADLGISLHTSSSGRDLPMKVVDMFGCGVPVLAKGFECVGELVKDGKNGKVFDTGDELGDYMMVSAAARTGDFFSIKIHGGLTTADFQDILTLFPNSPHLQDLRAFFDAPAAKGPLTPSRLRRGAGSPGFDEIADEWGTWDDNWERVVYRGLLTT